MILPPLLRPGDTIGIVSPAWGGAGAFPHRLERGIQQLERLGYRVVVGEHARNQSGWVSDTPENRAADLQALFADPQVRVIISAIGGDHSCQALPLLDFDLIRRNPKIFLGYSDIHVLTVAIYQQTGLVTFNGPAVLTDFAENPRMLDYTLEHLFRVLTRAEPPGRIQPADAWTEEFLDWATQKDLLRPRQMQPSPGWTWLKPGHGDGKLIGGCLETLQHLRGTPYWPDFTDALFFWETSEEKPSPQTIDGILMDYENMGVLGQIRGMLVGRPIYYTEAEKQELNQVILERTKKYNFPIVTGMDFGHTAPLLTLPVGVRARIHARERSFEIIEAAVRE
jgi:muramoyltetrapeptide carboxypeptidase LdcA involved in peptidoglycan recycling